LDTSFGLNEERKKEKYDRLQGKWPSRGGEAKSDEWTKMFSKLNEVLGEPNSDIPKVSIPPQDPYKRLVKVDNTPKTSRERRNPMYESNFWTTMPPNDRETTPTYTMTFPETDKTPSFEEKFKSQLERLNEMGFF